MCVKWYFRGFLFLALCLSVVPKFPTRSRNNFYDPLPQSHSKARGLLSLNDMRVSAQEVGFCFVLGPSRCSALMAPPHQQLLFTCRKPQHVLTSWISLHSCRSGMGPWGCSALQPQAPPRLVWHTPFQGAMPVIGKMAPLTQSQLNADTLC